MTAEALQDIRDRLVPMLRITAEEYRHRTPEGYPVVVDDVAHGVVGLELDPSYSFYIVDHGDHLAADYYYRSPRSDARATAMRAKYSGMPAEDHRPLSGPLSDQELRNLISELLSRWNFQPGIIFITDT